MDAMDSIENYDNLFKILIVGDSGVGKSCLLLRFTQDQFEEMSPTIGVDFKLKFVDINNKRVKLTIWDTAGQERFRTLTSSYYRGAQGIIFAYDATKRSTFESIEEVWMREVEMYSTIEDAVKMVIATKIDLKNTREVSKSEGQEFARKYGCLFLEISSKANIQVSQAFEELILKILETPSLLEEGSKSLSPSKSNNNINQSSSCC